MRAVYLLDFNPFKPLFWEALDRDPVTNPHIAYVHLGLALGYFIGTDRFARSRKCRAQNCAKIWLANVLLVHWMLQESDGCPSSQRRSGARAICEIRSAGAI